MEFVRGALLEASLVALIVGVPALIASKTRK